jgi:chitinase
MLINGFSVVNQGRFEGLRPDQVAICVIRSGSSNGALNVSEYETALKEMLKNYPNFRGIALWSVNEDVRVGGNAFLTAMRNLLGPR